MMKNTIKVNYQCRSGALIRLSLPAKFVVCYGCGGKGKHVNRDIDGHGLTAEDLSDPDFVESYMGGTFDVLCETCGGERVVEVVDEDRLNQKERILWEQYRFNAHDSGD